MSQRRRIVLWKAKTRFAKRFADNLLRDAVLFVLRAKDTIDRVGGPVAGFVVMAVVQAAAEDQCAARFDAGGDAQPLSPRTECDPAARTGRRASGHGLYRVAGRRTAGGAVG